MSDLAAYSGTKLDPGVVNLYRHLPLEESNRERVDVTARGISGRVDPAEREGAGGGWVNISGRFPVAPCVPLNS